MMAQLVQGLGADHVVWGSDAVWTGSPQWQIGALRRLEVPEDMQKKYGFKPLGPHTARRRGAFAPRRRASWPLYFRMARSATQTKKMMVPARNRPKAIFSLVLMG
jgi:hypothetical protein